MSHANKSKLSFDLLQLHQQQYTQTIQGRKAQKFTHRRRKDEHSSHRSKRRRDSHRNVSKKINDLHQLLNGEQISIKDISAEYTKRSNQRYGDSFKLLKCTRAQSSMSKHCGKKRKAANTLLNYYATKQEQKEDNDLNELYLIADSIYSYPNEQKQQLQTRSDDDYWYRQQIKQMEANHQRLSKYAHHKNKRFKAKKNESSVLNKIFEMDSDGQIETDLFKEIDLTQITKSNKYIPIILDDDDENIHIETQKSKECKDLNLWNLTLCDESSCALLFESDLNMDEMERMIIGRLQMFKWINSLSFDLRKDVIYNSNNHSFRDKLREFGLDNVKNDNFSHLILRLVFCENESLKQWFIGSECAFERIKYCKSNKVAKDNFLRDVSRKNDDFNFLSYDEFSFEDLCLYGLNGKSPIPKLFECSATEKWIPFHKVCFGDIPYLVANKRVYLQNGFAFVPNYLFYLVVEEKYKTFLETKLDKIKNLNLLSNEFMTKHPQILYEVNKIRHFFDANVLKQIGMSKRLKIVINDGLIHSEIVNKYLKFMPLCQQFIINELLQQKHIKNGGRLQLSLFFKGIGLKKSESLKFWKKYETKMDYAYSVNYHYSKGYSSTSCQKIIKSHTNSGDCNGCPFKKFEDDKLIKLIQKCHNELSAEEIKRKILNNEQRETLKCSKLFALSQGIGDIEDMNDEWIHPNEYFKAAYYKKLNYQKKKQIILY